jgi:hypothetical protein
VFFAAECGGVQLQSSALSRLRQEDVEFEASLGYKERPYLRKRWGREERRGDQLNNNKKKRTQHFLQRCFTQI